MERKRRMEEHTAEVLKGARYIMKKLINGDDIIIRMQSKQWWLKLLRMILEAPSAQFQNFLQQNVIKWLTSFRTRAKFFLYLVAKNNNSKARLASTARIDHSPLIATMMMTRIHQDGIGPKIMMLVIPKKMAAAVQKFWRLRLLVRRTLKRLCSKSMDPCWWPKWKKGIKKFFEDMTTILVEAHFWPNSHLQKGITSRASNRDTCADRSTFFNHVSQKKCMAVDLNTMTVRLLQKDFVGIQPGLLSSLIIMSIFCGKSDECKGSIWSKLLCRRLLYWNKPRVEMGNRKNRRRWPRCSGFFIILWMSTNTTLTKIVASDRSMPTAKARLKRCQI